MAEPIQELLDIAIAARSKPKPEKIAMLGTIVWMDARIHAMRMRYGALPYVRGRGVGTTMRFRDSKRSEYIIWRASIVGRLTDKQFATKAWQIERGSGTKKEKRKKLEGWVNTLRHTDILEVLFESVTKLKKITGKQTAAAALDVAAGAVVTGGALLTEINPVFVVVGALIAAVLGIIGEGLRGGARRLRRMVEALSVQFDTLLDAAVGQQDRERQQTGKQPNVIQTGVSPETEAWVQEKVVESQEAVEEREGFGGAGLALLLGGGYGLWRLTRS